MFKTPARLIVEVKDGRWNAFGELTYRNQVLIKYLEAKGGINESVADGRHEFKIVRKGLKLYTSLMPIK